MKSGKTEQQKLLKRIKGFCAALGDELGNLDADLRQKIETSIAELEVPVRIAVAGLQDANHHAVCEVLTGAALLPKDSAAQTLPLLHIHHGDTPKTGATVAGKQRAFKGCVVDKVLSVNEGRRVDLTYPMAYFPNAVFSVLPAYDSEEDKNQFLFDLLDETDIIIWCSNAGTPWQPHERRLWFTVPDDIKTRSILAFTGLENVPEEVSKRYDLEATREIVADEFYSVMSVATDHGDGPRPISAERLKASGGEALISILHKLMIVSRRDALSAARALRTELDSIPLGSAAAPPPVDLAPDAAASEASSVDDARGKLQSLLVDHARTCIEFAEGCSNDELSALFDAMNAMMADMTALLAKGLRLGRDHELMTAQCREAADLVTLLGYEGDRMAAQEAADLVKQIALDVWSRIDAQGIDIQSNNDLRRVS